MSDAKIEFKGDEGHRFDVDKLAALLQARLPKWGALRKVTQYAGGYSNPTFLLETDGGKLVLRKKPPGQLLAGAHGIDREFRIQSAVRQKGFPTPEMVHYCEDASVIGTPFYLMIHVEGRIFTDLCLFDIPVADRRAYYFELAQTLAQLHRIDYQACGLADYGRPEGFLARHVDRWGKQYAVTKTEDIPEMDKLFSWLKEHCPPSDETTLFHGDFRFGNVIFAPKEPRIAAVLDWELSTLGHPLMDLSYLAMPYHYEAVAGTTSGLEGLDLAALGIPDEASMLAEYCRETGRKEVTNWSFYLALNMFRLAAISQGVYRRGLQGIAATADAAEKGSSVQFLSSAGLRVIQKYSKV